MASLLGGRTDQTIKIRRETIMTMIDNLPSSKSIIAFFHCALCLKEKPQLVSPQDWSMLEVGFTVKGLQVWCKRHECNVIHINFQGQTHPANTSRSPEAKI